MKPKQIDFEDSAGKTIKHVIAHDVDEVLFIFTDDTYSLIYAYSIDDEVTVENGDLFLAGWWEHRQVLLDCGIVSQSAIDQHQKQMDMLDSTLKEQRLAEYLRLKKEFEGEDE